MKKLSILFVTLLCVSVSCVNEKSTDTEADIKAVSEVSQKVVDAWNNVDYESFISYIDADAVILPQNTPSLVGLEAIKALYSNSFQNFTFEVKETIHEIIVSGDYAYAMTNWTGSMNPIDGNNPVKFNNKVLAVYKKQIDGSWLVYRNMYNGNDIPEEQLSPELTD